MAAPKVKNPADLKTSSEEASATVVHRVAAYPIDVQILKAEGQAPLRGQIVKLTDVGFLVQVDASQYHKAGDNFQVTFELPALGASVQTPAKVIKTYATMESGKAHVKSRTLEVHFKNLSSSDRSNIHSYLVKSGQKKN